MNTPKTLTEVCHLLGITNRQLDKLLAIANIDKQMLATDNIDKRKRYLSEDQIEQIRATMPAIAAQNTIEAPKDINAILARLDALERMIRQLQKGRNEEQPPAARQQTNRKRTEPERGISDMPSGFISYFTWGERHHIPVSTVRGAIVDGRTPTVKGPWKHYKSTIKEALDSEGQQSAFDLWSHRKDFQECEQCPNHHNQ